MVLRTGAVPIPGKAGLAGSGGGHARRGNRHPQRHRDRRADRANWVPRFRPSDLGCVLAVGFGAHGKTSTARSDVWADVLLRPAFSEGRPARVRENLLSTLARRKDSPPLVAGLLSPAPCTRKPIPIVWPLAGTEESVRRITRATCELLQAFYRPQQACWWWPVDIAKADLARPQMENGLGGSEAQAAKV